MKSRIYILLSFSLGISYYAVAGRSFEKDNDLLDELRQIRDNAEMSDELKHFDDDRQQLGGNVPGEVEDGLFKKQDKERQPGSLELGGDAEKNAENVVKTKRKAEQSALGNLLAKFRATTATWHKMNEEKKGKD